MMTEKQKEAVWEGLRWMVNAVMDEKLFVLDEMAKVPVPDYDSMIQQRAVIQDRSRQLAELQAAMYEEGGVDAQAGATDVD